MGTCFCPAFWCGRVCRFLLAQENLRNGDEFYFLAINGNYPFGGVYRPPLLHFNHRTCCSRGRLCGLFFHYSEITVFFLFSIACANVLFRRDSKLASVKISSFLRLAVFLFPVWLCVLHVLAGILNFKAAAEGTKIEISTSRRFNFETIVAYKVFGVSI